MTRPKDPLATIRKARQADAKRKLGLVPRQVWAHPDHWDRINKFVADLMPKVKTRKVK
jgi:hypothetical protein